MRLESRISTAEFRLGSVGAVAISLWLGKPLPRFARSAIELVDDLRKGNDGMHMLAVLAPSCPLPDDAVRKTLAAGLSRDSSKILSIAQVVEGQGFRNAALRGVLTSMGMMIRPPYPQRATKTVAEAAAFIEEHSGPSARHIIAAVKTLREQAVG